MNRQIAVAIAGFLFAIIGYLGFVRADSSPATQPTTQIQTGEVDLTFTQRSPMSKPEELARRLYLKPADVKDDYDLSKLPFKAYIPTNYDPSVAHGLFVYLGYKDTVSSPPLWRPLLEKYHLIFISPVSHTGSHYKPDIPLWQTLGLAFDAVYNCKKQFNIDDRRIYLMSFNDDSLRTSYCAADLYAGFIVTCDSGYNTRINLPGGSYYPSSFRAPPAGLMTDAKSRAFFLIDDGSADSVKMTNLIAAVMRHDDFGRVMTTALSLGDDLHFPNLKAEWFEQQALPFLDKASATSQIAKSKPDSPSTMPAPGTVAAPDVNAAQHMLDMAQLYMKNGHTDLARRKLQQIIANYPTDPAAEKAKELLGQLNQ